MDVALLNTGRLHFEIKWHEVTPELRRPEIVAMHLEGPPLVVIGRMDIEYLVPSQSKIGDDLMQIGLYIFRRTQEYDIAQQGFYWIVEGHGEWYLYYWRVIRSLDHIWRRVLLTLAVWGLANWPQYGAYPTWADVIARWKRE